VLDQEIPCPLCKQPINLFGDHATCCTKPAKICLFATTLASQFVVEDFASDAMLSPVLEKKGILGNTTGRRPGDVTLEKWSGGKRFSY
jgi:hypothetical protein